MSQHDISRPVARTAVIPRGVTIVGLAAAAWVPALIGMALLFSLVAF